LNSPAFVDGKRILLYQNENIQEWRVRTFFTLLHKAWFIGARIWSVFQSEKNYQKESALQF
jgi:prolipoprotein diacylglyceryltransferase